MMKPRTAFSTLGCPDWSFAELISGGQAAGFDGVEIRMLQRETNLLDHPALRPDQWQTRRGELDAAGFRVCGLSSSVNFHDQTAARRCEQIQVGRRYLDVAAVLGADWIRVFGDVLHPLPVGSVPVEQVADARRRATIQQVADGLQELGEYAATLGLSVIIETHGDFANSEVLRETLDRVTSPAVGVLWDTHHPWRFFGEPLAVTFERLQPWIRHTHWKDSVVRPVVRPVVVRPVVVQAADQAADQADWDQADWDLSGNESARTAHRLMSGHRHADYVLFRGGEFPAVECMQLLKRAGYAGWYSLEWEVAWHPELESPEVALPLFPPKLHELWNRPETTSCL